MGIFNPFARFDRTYESYKVISNGYMAFSSKVMSMRAAVLWQCGSPLKGEKIASPSGRGRFLYLVL